LDDPKRNINEDKMKFKTEVEIDGDYTGHCQIEWEIDFECRSWGVKSIYIIAPEQTITFENTTYNEEDDEIYEEVTLNLEDISCEHSFKNISDTICPTELHIRKNGDKLDVSLHF
jgi:hypothetical protein